jgi:signal peptidase II
MALSHKKVHALLYGLLCLLIITDQMIKYAIVNYVHIAYFCNTGIAFGINVHQTFFIILWIIIVGCVVYHWWLKRSRSFFQQIPFVLILSGGIGNIIDRVIYGCVIDYIPFAMFSTFNFADALISFGAFLWIRQLFRMKNKNIDE